MSRREKWSAWAIFIGVFALAFAISLSVGIVTRSHRAAAITYFLVLPALGLGLILVMRRSRPERTPRYGRLFWCGYALVTACLVAAQFGPRFLGWAVAPAMALVLVTYMVRRSRDPSGNE